MTPTSAGRRSSASAGTALPTSSCRTAEISLSMYMAARTMAIAPTTAQPQPMSKMPLRTRNSAAKALEPGTASAMAGRDQDRCEDRSPTAMPPRRRSSPVLVRRSIAPASRKRAAEMSPWLTICRRRAGVAGGVHGEDPDHDQVHLCQAGVGDHTAHVRGAEGDKRPVDETDRGEDENRRPPVVRRAGVEGDRYGQKAVGGGLGDDPGEHGGHLGRRLAVRRAASRGRARAAP